jgi:hypothetical protein
MTRVFVEGGTLEEPVLSELLVHAAAPRPFAPNVTPITIVDQTALHDWRDAVLPWCQAIRSTPGYRAARLELSNAVDAIGYPAVRDLTACRAAEMATAIARYASHAGNRESLSARDAQTTVVAAALAAWAAAREGAPEARAALRRWSRPAAAFHVL